MHRNFGLALGLLALTGCGTAGLEPLKIKNPLDGAAPAIERQTITLKPRDMVSQGGGTVQFDDNRPGAKNSILWMWSDNGHWIEWTISNTANGKYRVLFRYSTEGAAPRQLMLNGKPCAGLDRFTLPATGGWNKWQTHALLRPVGLRSGLNTLRVVSLGGASMNLDEIVLQPVD